jgi:hypothetical protein
MIKWLIRFLLLAGVPAVFAVTHDTLNCFRIDSAHTPVIDGDMADWPGDYRVGTLKFSYNLFCIHPNGSWDYSTGFAQDYNAELYLCHTDSFFYIGWKTTVDNVVLSGHDPAQASDRLWITWGNGNRIFLFNDALVPDSNPFFDNGFNKAWIPNVKVAVGGLDFPCYEVRLNKSDIGRGPLNIGYLVEDYDGPSTTRQLGIGCRYSGTHASPDCFATNCWQDPAYFPITKFVETLPIGVESPQEEAGGLSLAASPNPCNPSTSIAFSIPASARVRGFTISVYDLSGQKIRALHCGTTGSRTVSGRITWDGKDDAGRPMASGVYVISLLGKDMRLEKRLTLFK